MALERRAHTRPSLAVGDARERDSEPGARAARRASAVAARAPHPRGRYAATSRRAAAVSLEA